MKKNVFCILFILFYFSLFAGVGTTSIDILKVPSGIKSQGLGGSFIAAGNDVEAIDFNPAGLKNINKKQILFIHDFYLQDIFYDSIYYGQSLDEMSSFGVAIKYLNSGTIIEQKETPIGTYDGEGSSISGFNYLIAAAYAIDFEKIIYNEFTKNLNVGITLKLSGESLGNDYSNFGFAFDIGGLYEVFLTEEDFLSNRGEFIWNKTGFGIVFKNLGTSFNGNITPISFELGSYTQFLNCFVVNNKIKLSADFGYNLSESLGIKCGIEYTHFIDNIILTFRMGGNFSFLERLYSGINLGGGIGFKTKDIQYSLDYVFLSFSELGNNNKIGVSLIF